VTEVELLIEHDLKVYHQVKSAIDNAAIDLEPQLGR
jgi:hypothetical protein